MFDWIKKDKKETVKLKVSDFNNTVETEEVEIVGDDFSTSQDIPVLDNKQDQNEIKQSEKITSAYNVIDWNEEVKTEYEDKDIISLLATEIFENKEVYNILANKVASQLTKNIIEFKFKHEIALDKVNQYKSRTSKIRDALYPILENEIQAFVNEKIGGTL